MPWSVLCLAAAGGDCRWRLRS